MLNAAHPKINYPMDEKEILKAVHVALRSGCKKKIEDLKDMLDHYNNLGCSL